MLFRSSPIHPLPPTRRTAQKVSSYTQGPAPTMRHHPPSGPFTHHVLPVPCGTESRHPLPCLCQCIHYPPPPPSQNQEEQSQPGTRLSLHVEIYPSFEVQRAFLSLSNMMSNCSPSLITTIMFSLYLSYLCTCLILHY